MTGKLRRSSALGLSVLILMGTLSPSAFAGLSTPSESNGSSSFNESTPSDVSTAQPSSSTTYDLTKSDFSLTISPTRLVIGAADFATTQQIQAINRGQAPVNVTVQKRNFTANADGSPLYKQDAPYAGSAWVTLNPVTFTLAPGATQIVTASVKVPANAEPGDHQLSIIFLVPPKKTTGNISINRGIGTPVYITVPGEIVDSMSLTDLSAPGFATGGPVPLTAIVHNNGSVHKDYRGNSPLMVEAPGETAVFPDFTVPRDSIRNIATTWDPPLIGVFNPTVTLTNADGTTSSRSVQVIIFPIQKALILLGILAILFFGFWFIRRQYKSSVRKAAAAMNRPAAQGDA